MKIRLRLACIRDQEGGVKEVVFSGPKPATEQDKLDRADIESVTLAYRTRDAGKASGYKVGDEIYMTISERQEKPKPPQRK